MSAPSRRIRINATIKLLERQVIDSPHARLMFAIIKQAGNDLEDIYRMGSNENIHERRAIRASANAYLRNPAHAYACGLDPTWVTESFSKAGLLDPQD